MLIQPMLLALLLVSIIALSLAVFFIISSFNKLIRKIEKAEQEKTDVYKTISDKAGIILAETHRNQLLMLDAARKKIDELLNETKDFNTDAESILNKRIQEIAEKQKKAFDEANEAITKQYYDSLNKIKEDDLRTIESVGKKIEGTIDKDLSSFTEKLTEETVGIEKQMQQKANSEYDVIKHELDDYKKQQFEKINSSIYPIVRDIATTVLGKSISLADHEDLVMKALDTAKKEFSPSQAN